MNKKINFWSKGIKIVAFTVLAVLIFNYCTNVLYNKTDASNYKPFFSMDEDFDVLFLGTSVTVSGISPLDLWNDYGIVSFNLANNGQALPNNYYALKSALETQQPKVVVVDISYIFLTDILKGSGEVRLHQLLDNMPMGLVKVEAIQDLVPSDHKGDFLLPFLYYHDRWKELIQRDFEEIVSINRGGDVAEISMGSDGEIFDTSVFAEKLNILSKEEKQEYPELSQEYIQKIVELCKEKGIDVLFVNLPCYAWGEVNHGDGETLQRMWNQFYVTAEELEVDYINGLHHIEEMGFDFVDDLRDWRHISISGNKKVTSYLGAYLQEKYGVPDRRGEAGLEYWDEDYKEFCEYRERVLEQGEKQRGE